MPCSIPSHTHHWPRSGTLSICKCESKCDFCLRVPTKDYKPASALRKHVLRHIKNDKMPLTLKKGTDGRPGLWISTTAVGSQHPDQPELEPPSFESTVTPKPILGTFDTKGGTTKAIDIHFISIKDMLFREDNPTYISRLCHAPNALVIVEAAVVFSKTYGPEKTMIRRGLYCLRLALMECREHDKLASDYNYRRTPSIYTSFEQYRIFRRALHDATRQVKHSEFTTVSKMVLELFFATCVLSTIARLFYGLGSIFQEFDVKPMLLYFETMSMTLDELCDDVYRSNLPGYLGQSPIQTTDVAADLYRKSIFDAANLLPVRVSGAKIAEIIGWISV